MPLYTFENKRTKKTFDDMMSISEQSYLKKNKHIKQNISSVNIVGGIQI